MNLGMQKAATRAVKEGLRTIDKRQGYRGAIDQLTDDEETSEDSPYKKGMFNTGEIKPGAILKGVVSEVSAEGVGVLVNDLKGKILKGDMIWAKKKLTGQDIRKDFRVFPDVNPKSHFKVGDVIWVKVKTYQPVSKEATFSLEQEPEVQGSLISLDPTTGAIRAMVGGYDFERSEFNRAVFAKRALR